MAACLAVFHSHVSDFGEKDEARIIQAARHDTVRSRPSSLLLDNSFERPKDSQAARASSSSVHHKRRLSHGITWELLMLKRLTLPLANLEQLTSDSERRRRSTARRSRRRICSCAIAGGPAAPAPRCGAARVPPRGWPWTARVGPVTARRTRRRGAARGGPLSGGAGHDTPSPCKNGRFAVSGAKSRPA